MTNQSIVFSKVELDITTWIAAVTDEVNTFIANGIASGYTNFDIEPVVVTPVYDHGIFIGKNWFSVQVNYYVPSLEE